MALIAEFSLPTESFALGDALDSFPELSVEAGQIVAHSPDTTMPCLWVPDQDHGDVLGAFERDPTVEEVRATSEFQHRSLYHVAWADEVEAFVTEMVDHEGAILAASADADRWRLRLRFMTRDQFESFRDHFEASDRQLRLEQLFEAELPGDQRGDLTPRQYRTLEVATELGYFEVPRAASLRDVAAELDVSHQAVSERIRRGTANLVRDALVHTPGSADS